MILIADSGSSKTDWAIVDGKEKHLYKSLGLNPYFLLWNEIHAEIRKVLDGQFDFAKVDQVFFYGSGCTGDAQVEKVKLALKQCFINADLVVDSDIYGAIQATANNSAGIVSILGTGTNSCYFDGKKISRHSTSLGYLLGDEGSGTWLGRELIRAFAYNELPETIHSEFVAEYQITIGQLKREVYQLPKPNTYIASYAPFLKKHLDNPFIYSLVKKSFSFFYEKHLSKLIDDKDVPFHFVGSIAYQFQDVLKEVLVENEARIGNIVAKPIEGLLKSSIMNN